MQSQSRHSVTIMQIVMLVVFACCTLFSLITAGLVFNAGQPGSAIFFLAFGLLFGCLTSALLQGMRREKSSAGAASVDIGGERTTFVPHWFLMAALVMTAVAVLGSILCRVLR